MKTMTRTLSAFALIALFAIPLSSARAQTDGPVFELRQYTATPGNLDALLTRFRDHTRGLFSKHGMTNVGYWVPTDPELAEDTLIYILRHESREAADASWQAFGNDPEWQRVAEESNADGQILENVERTWLTPTDFSMLQ